MAKYMEKADLLKEIGDQLRALRLRQNLDQRQVARQAGVSLHALQNLENGCGASLGSLVQVVTTLKRTDWLLGLAPESSFSPLQILKTKKQRVRASKPRKEKYV
jgi:cytoskeletal protein RodZ